MTVPTAKDISAMTRLMKIMNGEKNVPMTPSSSIVGTSQQSAMPLNDSAARLVDMRNILEKFNSASNGAMETLLEDAQSDPALRESLVTESIDNGMKIGDYEVRQGLDTSGKKPKKIYDVVYSQTGHVIAEGLYLYSAAHALTKLLNMGRTIMDPDIQKVVRLEETFCKNRIDAARFMQMSRRAYVAGEHEKAALFEDRFDAAKQSALQLKDELKQLNASIR